MIGVASAAEPVAFSHKIHAELKFQCTFCHATAETAELAGFPAVSKCAVCHQQLKTAKPFPSKRVYQLPDFVFFSHGKHYDAKIECQTCHGPVLSRDVLTREKPITMKACVDCHKANRASIACNLCHELNQ
jgi:hypothetical protein